MLKLSPQKLVTSILIGIMATASSSAFSGGLDDANMLKKFSLCDASFFSYLNEHAEEAKQLAPVEQQQNFLNFKVGDRLKDGAPSTVRFTHPLQVGTLTILGYQDNYSNLGRLGRYYYWGFIVKGLPDETLHQLPHEIAQNIYKNGEAYSRNEWKPSSEESSKWMAGAASPSGEPTKPGTIERLLILDKNEGASNESTLFCSLQGDIYPVDLKDIRPDQYRIESSLNYIQAKWILATAITQRYKLDYKLDTPTKINSEAKKLTEADKKKYQITNNLKPDVFWKEYESIQRDYLNNIVKNIPDAQERIQKILANKMSHILDKHQIEEVGQEPNAVTALVISNAVTNDDINRLKDLFLTLKPSLKKHDALIELEKKYSTQER
ncbi:hypothetical protein [Chromobacterium vaccinii]|uniref:hypothetical protein n=1 Tax=Chromobacterium vaccinii TaxID=1108595 RepID=UPI000AFD5B96|nr:hypothetical protein [Chromobacterium vaccinii]